MSLLATGVTAAEATSSALTELMQHQLSGVNSSLDQLASDMDTRSDAAEQSLNGVKKSVKDLESRVGAFESHPPTIGEVSSTCVHCIMGKPL